MTKTVAQFQNYLIDRSVYKPLFFCGNSTYILKELPDNSIDCAITSPPYWGQRQYSSGGIGLEKTYREYIDNLLGIFKEIQRVIKPTGSFWLNLGDRYDTKTLIGIPWRIAIALTDQQGWVLRNSVIWNKVKGGPDNSLDRLRNIHENLFHFVKAHKGYYYDVDSIRKKPGESKVVNGAVVSATGVSGIRYKWRRNLILAAYRPPKSVTQCTFTLMT